MMNAQLEKRSVEKQASAFRCPIRQKFRSVLITNHLLLLRRRSTAVMHFMSLNMYFISESPRKQCKDNHQVFYGTPD